MSFKRRDARQAILKALQDLGGTASRTKVRQQIANDDLSGFTQEDVFGEKVSRSGNTYAPFMFDFNFSIRELALLKYIDPARRGQDLVLTQLGRSADPAAKISKEQQKAIDDYWKEQDRIRAEKKQVAKVASKTPEVETADADVIDDEDIIDSGDDVDADAWKTQLVERLKRFSPGKFESFSRLLISKMGVRIDKRLGQVLSGDHGLDGFGYFESDEFRTSRVAIQAKRYTEGAVSEPEIDKFKGVMDGYNAEYGIFITTSYFTDNAKKKAVQGTKSVTLIDGPRIADLVEQYQLHISPVATFSLDDYYFENN